MSNPQPTQDTQDTQEHDPALDTFTIDAHRNTQVSYDPGTHASQDHFNNGLAFTHNNFSPVTDGVTNKSEAQVRFDRMNAVADVMNAAPMIPRDMVNDLSLPLTVYYEFKGTPSGVIGHAIKLDTNDVEIMFQSHSTDEAIYDVLTLLAIERGMIARAIVSDDGAVISTSKVTMITATSMFEEAITCKHGANTTLNQ
jgi:hypothetical protein